MDVLCEAQVTTLTLKHTTTSSRRELYVLKAARILINFIWKPGDQWRSEGGAGGGICPRAPPGEGRQNPDKEFFLIYILRNFEKSERIQ